MLTFENYLIRLIDVSDIDFISKIRLSNEVQKNVGNHLFTNNFLQKNWIEKVSLSSKEKYFTFEAKIDSVFQKIGLIGFTEIDFINRSVCVGGHILEDFTGRGYGKKMYEGIFDICYNIWGMNRVWLLVLKDNFRGISLYKKVGFEEEGVLRQAIFKNGNYVDYILMSKIKNIN